MARATVIACLMIGAAHAVVGPINTGKYSYVGVIGACRGNGGSSDKPNYQYQKGLSQADCEARCDSLTDCVGYGYQHGTTASPVATADAWCLIYGPNLAGTCSDATLNTDVKCAAKGTCSDPSVDCSATADCVGFSTSCTNVGGTWTSAGAVWTLPDLPWDATGGSFDTDYIATANENAAYECYDIDTTDHLAKCAEPTTGGPGTCASAFAAAATTDEAACCSDCTATGACVYTAAPTMETEVVPHVGDVLGLTNYQNGKSGACRGVDSAGVQVAANSKGSKTCDINGVTKTDCGGTGQPTCSMTQAECEAGCAAENAIAPGRCTGYHHAEGGWCGIFGPCVDQGIGFGDPNSCWTYWTETAKTIAGTNTNLIYMCWEHINTAWNTWCLDSDNAMAQTLGFGALLSAALLA